MIVRVLGSTTHTAWQPAPQPVLHLGDHFAGAVAGRENLDRQIGSTGEETSRKPAANAVGPDKRRIGRANRIGVVTDLKTGFRPHDDAQTTWFHEIQQDAADAKGNRPVF